MVSKTFEFKKGTQPNAFDLSTWVLGNMEFIKVKGLSGLKKSYEVEVTIKVV